MVIAAGSVMKEPRSGPTVSIENHHATGVLPPAAANKREAGFREAENRLRARNGHDHENEDGFGVFDAIEVVDHRFPPLEGDDRDRQGNRPDSEDRLDLTKKMENGASKPEIIASASYVRNKSSLFLLVLERVIGALVAMCYRQKS